MRCWASFHSTQPTELNNSIDSFELPKSISDRLHDARKARNEVAHSLTVGMHGCLDTKVDVTNFLSHVKSLIGNLTFGDLIISKLLSDFNKEPFLNLGSIDAYCGSVINWVTGE